MRPAHDVNAVARSPRTGSSLTAIFAAGLPATLGRFNAEAVEIGVQLRALSIEAHDALATIVGRHALSPGLQLLVHDAGHRGRFDDYHEESPGARPMA
jgi:hypothetical protein